MKTEIVMVTPELAANWMIGNIANRKLRQSIVDHLSGIMSRGEWVTTHQGIAISDDGKILDGQHRLSAIIKSGISIDMQVSFGVSEKTFSAIDIGLTRTLSDITKIDKKSIEVVRFLAEFGLGINKLAGKQAVELESKIAEHIRAQTSFCNKATKTFSSAPFRAAAIVHSAVGNRDYAFDIYRRLAHGDVVGLPDYANRFVRRVLMGNIDSLGKGRGGQKQNDFFLHAFNIMSPDCKKRNLVHTEQERESAIRTIKKIFTGEC